MVDTSASEAEEETNINLRIPRFNGSRTDDYGLWRMRLRAACRMKGVWDVVENLSGDSASSTSSTSANPGSPGTSKKREKASGIIISALGDTALRVVMEADEDPAKMLKLLDGRYASSRTVSRIAVQTQLFRMSYDGQNMSDYIDQYTSLFSQLERMGKDAAIPETHKAPMLVASIDPNCALESTATALRTKDSSDLTWDYVATTLIDEYKARQVSRSFSSQKGSKKKSWKNKKFRHQHNTSSEDAQKDQSNDESEFDRTINAFAAALKSSKGSNQNEKPKCSFCNRVGHSAENCFMNPDNPKNRLPKSILESVNGLKSAKGASEKQEQRKNPVEFAGSLTDHTTILPPDDQQTYADSGATIHIFHNRHSFVPGSLKQCQPRTVALADKREVQVNIWGEVILPMKYCIIRLHHVLFVESIRYNLVSTGKLADNGIESLFRRKDLLLKLEVDGTIIGNGIRALNGMYILPSPNYENVFSSIESSQNNTMLWHQRLAHLNMKDLMQVHKFADGVPKLSGSGDICRACRMGKAHKLPFHGHFERSANVGDLIHSDVIGPLGLSFPDRYRYVCTFLDDHSRFTFLAFLRHRSEVGSAFMIMKARLDSVNTTRSVQFSRSDRLMKLHSDGAKEYKKLENDLGGKHIISSFSPPYTPELNGIAERVNRTLEEGARACLIQADLPEVLWPFALKHVVSVRNRLPHTAIKETPFNLFYGSRPDLKHLRVFGSTAYVLQLPRPSKFGARAQEGIFLEAMPHGIYKVLVHDKDEQYKLVESRNVTFNESEFRGASNLVNFMDDEEPADDDASIYSNSDDGSQCSDHISIDISNDGHSDRDEENVESSEIHGPTNNDDLHEKDHTDDGNASQLDKQPELDEAPDFTASDSTARYPRRVRRKPQAWYMATTAQTPSDFNITTCDEGYSGLR